VSGFVGILHVDGRPLERPLLEHLTEFQKFRGPDGQNVWMDGAVGFGHTLLKTYPESEREVQPLSLDGKTWIVADCRVDARPALIAELARRGHHDLATAPHAELVLRAYAVWGEDCVHHLLGDFTFAIWDGTHRRLFCARDQMGVKPFYYACVDSRLIFSNSLDCVRQHPAVSGDLNELAIADFLLFDMIQEPGATAFRDIRRLPPAHTLTHDGENLLVRRYWTLPESVPIHHERDSDYVEQFQELMDTAVADRLRTNAAGVLMSGGLDSATVAASAQKIFASDENLRDLCAYTEVFDHLIPHEERHYAGLVAEALKIPIQFQISDAAAGACKSPGCCHARFPEPVHSPWSESGLSLLQQLAATRRIALTGFGGDPTLSCLLTVHFLQLLKGRHFGRLMADVARYLATEGRLSRLYIRTRWRRWFPSESVVAHYPQWLNPDLEKRLGLRKRWKTLNHEPAIGCGVRPIASEATLSSSWPALFEEFDSGVTRVPVEVRHPFFDLRLVSFLLALPALPWCSDKELLRHASRGVLPDAVRLRRKSPLLADPLLALLRRPESKWLDSFTPCADLTQFVEPNRIPKVLGEKNTWNAWINLRPLSLNFWLRSKGPSGITN
jgi:asparagine synthase (glutamine-hydrolysing)